MIFRPPHQNTAKQQSLRGLLFFFTPCKAQLTAAGPMAPPSQRTSFAGPPFGRGGGGGPPPPPPPPPAPAPPPEPAAPPPGTNPLGAFDPQLLTRMLPLMQSLTQTSGPTQQLLTALRPFLREEKQEKLQRAAQLAKLIHLGKQFLTEWGGGLV